MYEIPFGVTLRELLEMAGGMAGDRALKAVLFGGAAGSFATAEHLDVRLTFEDLRAAGLPLGSGVVMVFDESRDLRDVLSRLGHFFAHESCGKCYPCQLGTQRQKEVLDRVAEGKALQGDVERLQDVGWTMIDASLCGLGQTAATAVLSAIKLWPELFEAPGSAIPSARTSTSSTKVAHRKAAVSRPAVKGTTSKAKKAATGKSRVRTKSPQARKTGARKRTVRSKRARRSG